MKHDGGTGNVTIDENQYGTYNNNKNNNNNSSKYSYEICE
jgi:hypothetical protein